MIPPEKLDPLPAGHGIAPTQPSEEKIQGARRLATRTL